MTLLKSVLQFLRFTIFPLGDAMSKIGHYEIVKELGRGGMGVVFKASEPSLGRFVAIKMLGDQVLQDENIRARFIREAQSAAKLNHPNIVQVYYVGEEDGKPFFAMEFVEGVDLGRVIATERQLQAEHAAHVILQAALGLGKAHGLGIVHRDIKPANILINSDGLVKVADFGIAHITDEKLTGTGHMLGTMGYFSPEVCKGDPIDGRSDLFSLGIVFFEMLTGSTPFKKDSLVTMVQEVLNTPIPDIRIRNQSADDQIVSILEKMTAKDPNARYSTCGELITDLKAYLSGNDVHYVPAILSPANGNDSQATNQRTAATTPDDATEVIGTSGPTSPYDEATEVVTNKAPTTPFDDPTVRVQTDSPQAANSTNQSVGSQPPPSQPPPSRDEPPKPDYQATVVASSQLKSKKTSLLLPLAALLVAGVLGFFIIKGFMDPEPPAQPQSAEKPEDTETTEPDKPKPNTTDQKPATVDDDAEPNAENSSTSQQTNQDTKTSPDHPKTNEQSTETIEQPPPRQPSAYRDRELDPPATNPVQQESLPLNPNPNDVPHEEAVEENEQKSAEPSDANTHVLNPQGNQLTTRVAKNDREQQKQTVKPKSITTTAKVEPSRTTHVEVTTDAEAIVALPSKPKLAVWIEGDRAIAGRLQDDLVELFSGDGYQVIDRDLIDARDGDNLIRIAKAAQQGGADVLIHGSVEILGSRDVGSGPGGRRTTVYQSSVAYKTYFPAGGRMLGSTHREEFEFSSLNAAKKAESQANQVIDVLIKNFQR